MNIHIGTLDTITSAFSDADLPDFRDHFVDFSANGASVNLARSEVFRNL